MKLFPTFSSFMTGLTVYLAGFAAVQGLNPRKEKLLIIDQEYEKTLENERAKRKAEGEPVDAIVGGIGNEIEYFEEMSKYFEQNPDHEKIFQGWGAEIDHEQFWTKEDDKAFANIIELAEAMQGVDLKRQHIPTILGKPVDYTAEELQERYKKSNLEVKRFELNVLMKEADFYQKQGPRSEEDLSGTLRKLLEVGLELVPEELVKRGEGLLKGLNSVKSAKQKNTLYHRIVGWASEVFEAPQNEKPIPTATNPDIKESPLLKKFEKMMDPEYQYYFGPQTQFGQMLRHPELYTESSSTCPAAIEKRATTATTITNPEPATKVEDAKAKPTAEKGKNI